MAAQSQGCVLSVGILGDVVKVTIRAGHSISSADDVGRAVVLLDGDHAGNGVERVLDLVLDIEAGIAQIGVKDLAIHVILDQTGRRGILSQVSDVGVGNRNGSRHAHVIDIAVVLLNRDDAHLVIECVVDDLVVAVSPDRAEPTVNGVPGHATIRRCIGRRISGVRKVNEHGRRSKDAIGAAVVLLDIVDAVEVNERVVNVVVAFTVTGATNDAVRHRVRIDTVRCRPVGADKVRVNRRGRGRLRQRCA